MTRTVKAHAGISMMEQWRFFEIALSWGACSMSSGANLPTALAIGRIPFMTNEGSFGRRKCFGLDSAETNKRVALVP
jgi:hypothetical protein